MLIRILLSTLLCLPLAVVAATRCYNEAAFPAAIALEAEPSGAVRVTLGEHFALSDGRVPMVRYTPDGGWQLLPGTACSGRRCPQSSTSACREFLGRLPGDPSSEFDPQRVSACVEHDDVIYFGLHAYQGEGIAERGGLGRYSRASGQVEMRWPVELADKTVSLLLHDGAALWVVTEYSFECMGHMAGGRPFRYLWADDAVEPVINQGCGFLVYDLAQVGDEVWLATDLGVSRLWREGHENYRGGVDYFERTTHFVPRREPSLQLAPVDCDALYDELLTTVTEATGPADGDSPFGTFFSNLAAHQPDYLQQAYHRHHRRRPADTLWVALQEGGRERALQLLEQGVNPHWRGTNGRSVVMRALEEEALDILGYLLERGVNLDTPGGDSAVDFAVWQQRSRLLQWLLERGVRPGSDALSLAVERGDEGLVRTLLDAGASPDEAGWRPPPLTVATRNDATAIAQTLLSAGAATDIVGEVLFYQPLYAALERNNTELVELLIQRPVAAITCEWLAKSGRSELTARLSPGTRGAEAGQCK